MMPSICSQPLLIAIFILLSLTAGADVSLEAPINRTTLPSSAWKRLLQKDWDAKLEVEGKTLYGSDSKINGYESKADFQVRKMLNSSWGMVLGADFIHKDQSHKKRIHKWDEVSLGFRYLTESLGLKWTTHWTYNYLPIAQDRQKELRNGSLQADIRTNISMGSRGRTRVRYRYTEHLTTHLKKGVDMRQSRLDVSPSYLLRPFSLGLQNRLTHESPYKEDASHIDLAPFAKYDNDSVETMLKVAYRPFISHDGRLWAEHWAQKPVYSLELAMGF